MNKDRKSSFMNKINLQQILILALWSAAFSLAVVGQTSNCSDEDFDCKTQNSTKAIQTEPKNADNYLVRANAYDNKGNFDSALKDYNKAVELDSKNTLIYYNRGLAFYAAINQSVVKLLKDKTDLPDYRQGYDLWRKAFDADRAGIYTVPVAKAIDEMEALLNQ